MPLDSRRQGPLPLLKFHGGGVQGSEVVHGDLQGCETHIWTEWSPLLQHPWRPCRRQNIFPSQTQGTGGP